MTAKFDPQRRLGCAWTLECEMELHSAIVVTLENMGWHPCSAIDAAWLAVLKIEGKYELLLTEEETID